MSKEKKKSKFGFVDVGLVVEEQYSLVELEERRLVGRWEERKRSRGNCCTAAVVDTRSFAAVELVFGTVGRIDPGRLDGQDIGPEYLDESPDGEAATVGHIDHKTSFESLAAAAAAVASAVELAAAACSFGIGPDLSFFGKAHEEHRSICGEVQVGWRALKHPAWWDFEVDFGDRLASKASQIRTANVRVLVCRKEVC